MGSSRRDGILHRMEAFMPAARRWRSLVSTVARNLGFIFSAGVLIASLSLNVVLARRLSALTRPPAPPVAGVHAGDAVSALPILTAPGEARQLTFDRPTLLYVFSPNCGWCRRDYQNLLALHRARGETHRFIGVTLDSTNLSEYMKTHPFPGDMFVLDPARLTPAMKTTLGLTPQTVVVRAGGIVEQAWPGALTGPREQAAEKYFGIQLPGVAAAPSE
jgi:hypothetical protein